MSEVGISPFAEVTAEELVTEVETALKVCSKIGNNTPTS